MPRGQTPEGAILALCAMLCAVGCASGASHPAPAPAVPISRLPASFAARIDALMLRAVEEQQLPGVSVAIGRLDGTILYANGYGFRNLARHEAADANTVYNIASITKQFTAASVLLLAHDRRLTIDDPVSRFVADAAFAKGVSLRDLMNHTSGIPDYFCLPGYQSTMSARDIVRLAASQPLRFRPRTGYEYSNTNYVLLGLAIEKAGGLPYAEFIRRRLLGAAQMGSSRVGEVPGDGPDDAIGYTVYDDALSPAPASATDLAYGAGAIDSTVVDLVRWDAALLGDKLLDGTERQLMLAPRPYEPDTTERYGFGLHEGRVAGDRELYHRGRNDGYGGINATFPDDNLSIALLANNEHFAPMRLVDQLYALVVPAGTSARTASREDVPPGDPRVDARAKSWIERLVSGDIDRAQLSPDAAQRYSAAEVGSLSTRLAGFGPLQSLTLMEKDSRCLGSDYTYQAMFQNAIAEFRFGVGRDGKIWNLAFDRED